MHQRLFVISVMKAGIYLTLGFSLTELFCMFTVVVPALASGCRCCVLTCLIYPRLKKYMETNKMYVSVSYKYLK